MQIQTIVFERNNWDLNQAKKWLSNHNFKTDPDIKTTQYRFRQKEPSLFKSFITKKVDTGLYFIFGK